ncbi:MAG: carbohydrate porin [Deltaproteobacteria bacterium]|nr:carbohydrate porin [Deltaproteobacteria bacterium]MBI3388395.1 carbohydrate porin [Deltaproteobacteria bacterium]
MSLRAKAGAVSDGEYSGGFLTRSTFTGDFNGDRNYLAGKGITFDATMTQVEQGVVSGGKNGEWEYGGRGDVIGVLDTQKLGLWPGGFLTAELEGNWSDSVNFKTGALSPPNENQLFPLPSGDNIALPALNFAQFLSHYAGVVVGKLDVMSADNNEFAHGKYGKGDTEFLNTSFNVNPVALMAPYSTLGTGVIVLPTADPHQAIVQFSVLSATGKPSTTGFDNFKGAIFGSEGRVRTDFFGLTGHQLVGGMYSNRQYTSIDQRLGFVIENQALVKHDGTWAVYYNFDQFLYETDKAAGNGVGLFGRFGASAGNPVPAQYMYSLGVGGKGLIPTRDLDRFGIGYYYLSINNPTLQTPIGTTSFLRDEWGFEAFYNVALTPWLLVTPDVQVVGPTQKHRIVTGPLGKPGLDPEFIGTATVLGVRIQLIL